MLAALLRISLVLILAAGPLVWPCCCTQAKANTASVSHLPPCCQARLAQQATHESGKSAPCDPSQCRCHAKVQKAVNEQPLVLDVASLNVPVTLDDLFPLPSVGGDRYVTSDQFWRSGRQVCTELCVWRI